MIVFLHPQYFCLPKLSGRDSLNVIRAPGWKQSPPLCSVPPPAGGAVQRDPGVIVLDNRLAVWLSFFLSTLPSEHSDLPSPACPAVHGKMCLQEAAQDRAGWGQHTADAAGQGHLLLLHILAQASALSGGYMMRCSPDPNREPASIRLKKQGIWHHVACSRKHT